MNIVKKSFFLIQQAASLLVMPRAHKRSLGTSFDTIASHSYHVSVIAYVIAKLEGLSDQEAQKACTMWVFHDLAEARTGDHDFIAKKYNWCEEEKAIQDQFKDVVGWEWLVDLVQEYEERQSHIAKCAKDADSLAQTYHEWVLMRQWNKLAEDRFRGDQEKRVPFLKTESAKKLATMMIESNPNERRRDEFVHKSFNQKDLTGK